MFHVKHWDRIKTQTNVSRETKSGRRTNRIAARCISVLFPAPLVYK